MGIDWLTEKFGQIIDDFALDFWVPHFDAETDLGLFRDVVVETRCASVVQQGDGGVKIFFGTCICRRCLVIFCVFVNVDSETAVGH
jgi:hypothetical protein